MKIAFLKIALFCAFAFPLAALAAASGATSHEADLAVQQWNGNAIAYSGYRLGQSPNAKNYPTQAHVLEVIQRNKLGIKVMLGIWLDSNAGHEGENAEQIANGIRLANKFDSIVLAVSVGNEILVSWSDHKLTEGKTIEYVEQVKKAVRCPVTVADDFLYWRQQQAKLADHVDFITMHTYPMWGHEDIDTAMASTIKDYESVCKAHPGKTVVIGEAGWASYAVGGKFVPRAGDEKKQKRYYEELTAWAKANKVTTFFFEAFDEPWKGAGTEGHWGLFSVDRKAKLAMQGLFQELMPVGPTSPNYDSLPTAK
jgi:exo-beta-1,3-glucanase (GH17 family)